MPIVSDDCPEPRTSTVCGRGRARPENHKSCKQRARRKALRMINHASACVTRAIWRSASRDRHHDMTDPRALHVVGGSKSNAKISKKICSTRLRNFELANGATSAPRPGEARNAAERRHVGQFAMSRRPRASQPRPTIPPRSRRRALPRPAHGRVRNRKKSRGTRDHDAAHRDFPPR